MKDETVLAVVGISSLTTLEIAALFTGFDGQAFSIIVAGVAGLAGYALKARTVTR